jgi:hypothetical protein
MARLIQGKSNISFYQARSKCGGPLVESFISMALSRLPHLSFPHLHTLSCTCLNLSFISLGRPWGGKRRKERKKQNGCCAFLGFPDFASQLSLIVHVCTVPWLSASVASWEDTRPVLAAVEYGVSSGGAQRAERGQASKHWPQASPAREREGLCTPVPLF